MKKNPPTGLVKQEMTALLVASSGGHLAQLTRLRPRFRELDDEVLWVTFDTPQSRSVLADQRVAFAAYTAPRDFRNVIRNTPLAMSLLRRNKVRVVISTGSGIALSFIPLARAHGIECHYIESAARSAAPSLTGRILGRTPGVHLHAQYRSWAKPPWRYGGSVFDGFQLTDQPLAHTPKRVVVTLGTIPYSFPRLVQRLLEIIPPDTEVLWQTGVTDVAGLSLDARAALPAQELDTALRDADVIVAHSGIGSALSALEAGRCPILVPRESRFGEHIDDHQHQIAAELAMRGLALARRVDELTWEDLVLAGRRRVVNAVRPPPFELAA